MAYRRSVTLGREEHRALIAATGAPEAAAENWRALMADVAFDGVSENTQRLMPAIFSNLRDAQQVPERERMRGAFKYAWSKNMGMVHDIRAVLADFGHEGIDYRLIKGAAIQAMCGSVGSRVMGDIDILVSASDATRAAETLVRCGFRRNTFSECDGHSDSGHHDALNFNKGESHVDVHVAEYKYPSRLLLMMMSTPPVLVPLAGMEMAVPPAELLVLHSAVHGCLASGPTDFIQAVVDVSVLADRTDPRRLVALASRSGTLLQLIEIDEELRRAGARPLGVAVRWHEGLRARAEVGGARAVGVVTESSSVLRRIRSRQRSDRALHDVSTGFNGRRRSYGLWLRLGQFAVFERAAVRSSGGFLAEPQGTWTSGISVQPFVDEGVPGMTASRISSRVLDWRFRVDFAAPQPVMRLVLDSASLDSLDAFVFCNGVPITRVVAGDPGTRDIVIRGLGRRNEVSVRALWTVCTECYRGLDDLTVRIDLGDDV